MHFVSFISLLMEDSFLSCLLYNFVSIDRVCIETLTYHFKCKLSVGAC